jgi:hypothetical protein
VTAASADRSGTAVVRITHEGEVWAGTTIRWSDGDIAISGDTPGRSGRAGAEIRVVDGVLYGTDPVEGGWIEQGSPANIDPDSGTTPGEHLAAVREDVEGVTLRRLGENIAGKSAGYRPLCSVVASVGSWSSASNRRQAGDFVADQRREVDLPHAGERELVP